MYDLSFIPLFARECLVMRDRGKGKRRNSSFAPVHASIPSGSIHPLSLLFLQSHHGFCNRDEGRRPPNWGPHVKHPDSQRTFFLLPRAHSRRCHPSTSGPRKWKPCWEILVRQVPLSAGHSVCPRRKNALRAFYGPECPFNYNMEPDRVRKIMFLLKGSFVRIQHAEFSCDCKFGLQLMHSHVPLFVL